MVVRGFDRCLTAYPQHVWEETAGKILRLPQTERNVRVFIRGMLSQAAEVKLDRQGRASIPRKLLERVGITDSMVIIGALDKLEFWKHRGLEPIHAGGGSCTRRGSGEV